VGQFDIAGVDAPAVMSHIDAADEPVYQDVALDISGSLIMSNPLKSCL
jgi:hypothetical protein